MTNFRSCSSAGKPAGDSAGLRAARHAAQAAHRTAVAPISWRRWFPIAAGAAAALVASQLQAAPQDPRLHQAAIASFKVGRFPEAYGRFVRLANGGHPPAARYALWMCEQGPELFGSEWDCTPDQVRSWASLAGVPVPSTGSTHRPAPQRSLP